jgi:hypothetical protein
MTKIILPFALCISIASCGQANNKKQTSDTLNQTDSIEYVHQVIQFIKQVGQQELNDSLFILEDSPSSLDYFDCLKSVLHDTTIFSKTEISIIKKQSKHPLIKSWTNSLIPNIKIVSADTIRNIFKDDSKGWKYFYNHIGRSVSGFSAPIFLKHFSYCLFYSDNSCGGLCGEGHLTLYKKEKDKWIAIKSYCNWVS